MPRTEAGTRAYFTRLLFGPRRPKELRLLEASTRHTTHHTGRPARRPGKRARP